MAEQPSDRRRVSRLEITCLYLAILFLLSIIVGHIIWRH